MALNNTFIKNSTNHSGKPSGDKYTDGGGMYLLVTAVGKYWRLNYRFDQKRKTLAMGVYPTVSLAEARKRREKARELLANDIDPSAAKREERQVKADLAANTFELVARAWLKKTAVTRKEITQNRITTLLEHDVFPYIGNLPLNTLGPRDVLNKALRKIEARGSIDTAHRAKQICGRIFRYGVAVGLAERDVTSDLRGALAEIPKSHFAAITEPKQAGEMMRSLFGYTGHPSAVAALKLAPLVFVRPGELRKAEWVEIDLNGAEWRIPGAKMKVGVDHIVPLSMQALNILQSLHFITGHGRYVFPSLRTDECPMSENTINAALRSIGYGKDIHTAHGFRAMARTILDEVLGERVDYIEHQLAHTVKDPNGRAYNRTAHLPARKKMMQRWADYLDKLRTGAEVIEFKVA
jgi:integrase